MAGKATRTSSTGHDNQHVINMMANEEALQRHHHFHHQQQQQQLGSPLSYSSPPTRGSPIPPGGLPSLGAAFEQVDGRSSSSSTAAAAAYGTNRLSSALLGTSISHNAKDSLGRSLSLGRSTGGNPQGYQYHQQPALGAPGFPPQSASPLQPGSPYSPTMPGAVAHAESSSSRGTHRASLLPTTSSSAAYMQSPRSPVDAGMNHAHSPRQQLAYDAGYNTSLPRYHAQHDVEYGSRSREASRDGYPAGSYHYQPEQSSGAGGAGDMLPYAYGSQQGTSSWSKGGGRGSISGGPRISQDYSSQHRQQQQQQQPPPPPPPQRSDLSSASVSRRLSGRARTEERKSARPPPPPPREEGLRRVRDLNDLRPKVDPAAAAKTRRADPAGGFVSPLKAMTSYLHHTYHLVNPSFIYELSFNPRRVLTKPSKPMYNNGHDNQDSDYILYVNDWLGNEDSNRYLILDVLGQGTFGQVVKCQNMKTHEIVAVKVIKNKPAYYKQSMMEVTILEMLNTNWDPDDKHHILRLRDTFIHAEHLCLVFELLSSNLYELIKQNSFLGLSTSLVRVFTTQLLDALTVLNEANLIHCDLKPENILLKTLQTPSIKLVDFGSACHEKQTVYTYIQSRFYRSPEVLLGLPYNSAIDMWSLGCIAVELFLGLPLFPGTSEYNQVCRIVEMLGLPPRYMLEQGKQTGEFFNITTDDYGRKSYRLKSLEQYRTQSNPQELANKVYFSAQTLPEIVKTYPLSRKSGKPADAQKEMANRASFVDFVTGLLNMDPKERWTPQQARLHPFITGEKFTKAFKPPRFELDERTGGRATTVSDASKHQFGGLPQTSTTKSGGRAYQDAAAYNQHLAQQQAYNTAHRVKQTQPPANNNPYASEGAAAAAAAVAAAQQHHQAQVQAHAQAQAHAAMTGYGGPLPTLNQSGPGRPRSNTQSQGTAMMSKMGNSGLSAGQALSPNGVSSSQRGSSQYNQLDLTHSSWQQQQQAAAGQQWAGSTSPSFASPPQGSMGVPSRQYQSPSGQPSGFSVVVEGPDRQMLPNPHDTAAILSSRASPSALNALSPSQLVSAASQQAGIPVPPPQAAYGNNSTGSASMRYNSNAAAGGYGSPGTTTSTLPFDAFDSGQPSIAQLMPALKPQQYHPSSSNSASSHGHGGYSSHGGVSSSGGSGVQQQQPQRHSMILPNALQIQQHPQQQQQGGQRLASPYRQQQQGSSSLQQHQQQQQAGELDAFGLPVTTTTSSASRMGQVDRRYSHQQDLGRF